MSGSDRERGSGMDLWAFDRRYREAGVLCGVDEAGGGPPGGGGGAPPRGPPPGAGLSRPHDSQKPTGKRREALYDRIAAQAEAWAVARVEVEEIDRTDILSARMRAMQLAIDGLAVPPDLALLDGNRDHGKYAAVTSPHVTVVGGDGKSASIAAASILAKVSRDRYVSGELDALYPQYGFAQHKGYGTRLHFQALDRFGPCPAHRRTFLKKWEAGRT